MSRTAKRIEFSVNHERDVIDTREDRFMRSFAPSGYERLVIETNEPALLTDFIYTAFHRARELSKDNE